MGMNPQKMMKQMQKMQQEMERVQTALQEEHVSATAGGGAVTATVSGGLELVSVKLSPEVVDPEDIEMLEDTVVAAVNEALRQAQDLASKRMGEVTGGLSGLGLPGF